MIKFYYLNHINSASTVFTPANENALFPIENIQDPRATKVYRSTTTPDTIVIDFGSAKDVDTVIVLPNKRNGFIWIPPMGIKANSSLSWGSPPVSTTLESTDVDTEFSFAHKKITTATYSYRYWQLSLEGASYVELGKIFLGEEKLIGNSRGVNLGWGYVNQDLSESVVNRYGQKFTDVIGDKKMIEASMSYLSADDVDDFYAIYDSCKTYTPFFVRVGDNVMSNNMNRFSGLFTFDSMPKITNEIYGRYNVSFLLSEST